MSSQTEETVKTPDTSSKSFSEIYRETQASQSEPDQAEPEETPETVPDDTPEQQQPAEEPAKPADQPEETGEPEDALLTAEEVGKLNKRERSLYEKAQKSLTQKTQRIAAERKEFEPWKPLIDSWKANPHATLEQLAQQLGVRILKPDQDTTASEQAKEIVSQLPEGLDFLEKPLEDRIQKAIDARLKPIEERENMRVAEVADAETKATIEQFGAKYPEWKKHEPAMLKYMIKYIPTGNVTAFEFMEDAHRAVTANITKAEAAKEVVAQIEKSAQASESLINGVSPQRVAHKRPPNATIKDAYLAAKRGEVWEND